MLSNLWDFLLYKPLLNAMAFLVDIIPGGDVGFAVIILTLLVKIVLFPLSHKAIKSQAKMAEIAPEINKIKTSGGTKEEQAIKTLELYKQYKVNPFSGCLIILIQIPIIFALYHVFLKGVVFEDSVLYSFVKVPQLVNTMFLGLIDMGGKSLFLAVLAGLTQYLQASLMPKTPNGSFETGSFQETFSKNMQMQMKYVFPFIVTIIAYSISGAIALYWVTSNIFAIGQQMYFNKKAKLK